MTEPTTTISATAVISAFSVATIYPNVENGIILGALCGSILLILNEEHISILRRIALFLISFMLGLLLAEFAVQLIKGFFPESLQNDIPASFGALITSAISVKPLIWLIKRIDNPTALFNLFKGKKSWLFTI